MIQPGGAGTPTTGGDVPAQQGAAAEPANPAATPAAPQADLVVTGTRSSLENAERFKQASPVTVDAISADDIGALPDESIADSLVRIPGLTANNDENGFTEVSVRGLGPDLSNTTYNGRVLPSTRADNRRLNLGDLPTEGIQRAYVQKTAQAATIEGGLAGTVGLESIHPLETRRRGLTLVGRATTDDVSQDIKGVNGYKPWGYRGEVTYVGQFADNLGLAVSYAHIQQTNAAPSTQLVNYMTRKITPDADGDGLFDAVPNNAGVNMGATNQKRDSVLAMLQWRPIDSLTASLDGFYVNSNDQSNPVNFISMGNATAAKQPTTYDVVDSVVRNYQGYTGLYQETVASGTTKTQQIEGGFNLKFNNGGPFSVDADVSYARARVTGHNNSAIVRTLPNNTPKTAAGQVRPFGYDSTDPENITLDFGSQSASDYFLTEIDEGNPDISDTAKAARLDFHYDRSLAFFGSMDFGARVDSRVKANSPDGNTYTFGGITMNPALNSTYLTYATNPLAKAADYLGGPNAVTFPLFDLNKLLPFETDPRAMYNNQPVNDFLNNSKITENTMALYYQANIEAGGSLTGNVGVRYFVTDQNVDGYNVATIATGNVATTPASVKHSYQFWLPSLNLKYNFTRKLALRAALSKTVSRAEFSDVRIATNINYVNIASMVNPTVNQGNPDIQPYTSKNADLGLEWYPNRSTSLVVQGFYKRVNNFITTDTTEGTITTPGGAVVPVTFSFSINDPTERYFTGIEVIARRDFDFLPGPLKNLGIRADYSHNWTDAVQQYTSLDATRVSLTPNNFTSQIYNIQLYYSTHGTDVRLAYRHYSPYVRENSNGYQSQPDGVLDLSGGIAVFHGIRVIGTIRNLTKSKYYSTFVDYRYPNGFGLPRNVVYQGRSFTIGARATF